MAISPVKTLWTDVDNGLESQGFESPYLQPRKLSGLSRRSLATAGRRRTSFRLAALLARATTRQATYETILLCLHLAKRSEASAVLYRFNTICGRVSKITTPAASFTRLNGSRGNSKPTSLFMIAIERLGLSDICNLLQVVHSRSAICSLAFSHAEGRRPSRRNASAGGHLDFRFAICDCRFK